MDNLNDSEVKHIAKLPKVDGQRLLARRLHLRSDDLQDDLRNESYLDYHYDVLQFAANRGMPWNEVSACLKFANEFFHHFISGSLPEAISTLHDQAAIYVNSGKLKISNAKKIIHHFISSVFPIHNLFKLVFTQERQYDSSTLCLLVEVPPDILPLKVAETYEHWEYHRRVNQVQSEKIRRENIVMEEEERLEVRSKELEEEIDVQLHEVGSIDIINRNATSDLVSSLVTNQLEIVNDGVKIEVMKMKNAADIALEIKAIPVPLAFQNPDKTKSPKSAEKSHRSKSPQLKGSLKRKNK